MKKYLGALALVTVVASCAVGRIKTPEGTTIEGFALGHSKLVVCQTSTSTTTSTTSSTSSTTSTTVPLRAGRINPLVGALVETILVPSIGGSTTVTPVTSTTSTTESTDAGCAKIAGGSLSSTFTEMIGLIGTVLLGIFTQGAFF